MPQSSQRHGARPSMLRKERHIRKKLDMRDSVDMHWEWSKAIHGQKLLERALRLGDVYVTPRESHLGPHQGLIGSMHSGNSILFLTQS